MRIERPVLFGFRLIAVIDSVALLVLCHLYPRWWLKLWAVVFIGCWFFLEYLRYKYRDRSGDVS